VRQAANVLDSRTPSVRSWNSSLAGPGLNILDEVPSIYLPSSNMYSVRALYLRDGELLHPISPQGNIDGVQSEVLLSRTIL
jgi:hypothetical protein